MRRNEWHPGGSTPAKGTLLATKLKNQILAIDPNLTVKLKNVSVNGMKMGCSGFVSNAEGKYVYVNTDHNHGMSTNRALYRTAEHDRDYTGGTNHQSDHAGLARAIVDLLAGRTH